MKNKEFDREIEQQSFYDPKHLRDLREASENLGKAFLDSDLGTLIIWCVKQLDRALVYIERKFLKD